ncbi:hypothetical protein JOE61_001113 [Nocardioides salarius]|uniref:Big-1 domain-containing protein n=1 Tax=Nocardioides salarius TaxID=374513 RepID=A0ABS2M7X9_9ACTN|nr:TonB-dependent receptor [Nocardioides salarius]MBM7507299.1 hypothetical protein [Nocardioides salarius]
MNSSGIKRGLAGSAITALAISGLPFLASSASAAPLSAQADANDVELYTPASTASVSNDGVNNSVHLVANGGTGVQQIRFQYNPDENATAESTGWVNIATVSRSAAGHFTTEWTPAPALYNTDVAIRALGLGAGQAEGDNAEINQVTVSPTADSVDIANAPDSVVGVFQQNYTDEEQTALLGAVSGTTSDVTGAAGVEVTTPYNEASRSADVSGTVSGTTPRTWSAPADFTGYGTIDATNVADEALVIATVNGEGDDAEAVELNRQSIRTVTAAADDATVIPGGSTDVTVTVLDAQSNPVVGAQVVPEGGAELDDAVYTNSQGEAVFEGLDSDANGETYAFYVNVDDEDGYQNGKDFRRTVTITEEAQTPTDLEATSTDGAAFDNDEYSEGDIFVTLTDQNDEPVAGQVVNYSWTFNAFPVAGEETPDAEVTTGTTEATDEDGMAVIPLPEGYDDQAGTYALTYYLNQDDTPGQGSGDLSGDALTLKAGEAELEFAQANAAPAGTNATFTASLELQDGTALAGRDVAFSLAQDGTDVVVAPQEDQPEGTERISATQAEDTTDAQGNVQVAVFDPANTTPRSELTADLTAETVTTEDIGNADASDTLENIQFVTDEAPEGTTVEITENTATGTPGVATSGTVTATTDDPEVDGVQEEPAGDLLVTLTVDGDAFFTDGTYVDAEDAEAGDQVGGLTDLGQTITVITDGEDGTADYQIGMGASEDFNDNGQATVNVTAAIAGDTDTEDYKFSSANPLNGGEVLIDFASESLQESGVIPMAPTTDDVAYDVQVTDQFGNLVGGESVTIETNNGQVVGTDADTSEGADGFQVTTDFNDNVEFRISSEVEVDATPTGTWNADETTFEADGDDEGDELDVETVEDANEIEGDGPAAEFYEVDFAESSYTLSQNGEETVPVGSTVIMTYTAADQNGEPIEFDVAFFRTGPDAQGDGNPAGETRATGEDGQVSYVFSGTQEGTATVTAIGYDDGEVVPESQVTDTVTFGEEDEVITPVSVEAIISASSNGPKKDVVRFQVDDEAEGATVKLFKIRGKKSEGNKRLVQVREDIVPEGGTLTFKVADRNGNKKTRFIAKVSATEASLKAKSNTQKPR